MGQPLDPQRAYLYGQFVLAAYTMFENDNPNPLRPAPDGIPDGYELGAWIHMSDFFLDIEEPKFYGIVAHKVDDPDVRVIAIRGTEGAIEWVDDAAAILVPFHQVPSAGRVAFGFDKIYKTLKVVKYTPPPAPGALVAAAEPAPFTGSFADQLEQLAISREVERGIVAPLVAGAARPLRPTVVTGHSLGAALQTLFVMENASKGRFDISTACTFASPRVGNMEFAHLYNKLAIDSWRIVNTIDLVPKLPFYIPIFFDYTHVDVGYPFSSCEFTKNNPVCWHSMHTYLHWLDPAHAVLPECVP
jgi:hypothetical protein